MLPSSPHGQMARAPLRIAMLVGNPGSTDARVRKEAESLASAGHAVTIFGLAARGLPAQEIINGVTYQRCREWHRRGAAGPVTDGACTPVKRNFVSTIRHFISPFVHHELLAMTFVEAAVLARPDIVHAHDFETLPAAVRVAARVGARVIYDMHELEEGRHPVPGPLLAWWKRTLEARALRRVSATLTVSPSIARYKARAYGIPQPTLVLNAPRLGPASNPGLRARCGLGDDVPLAVYAGNASEGRGIEQLIEAIELYSGMHLALLGQIRPGLRASLEASRERLGGRLHLLDPVPHAEVVAHIASADLGICTIPGSCLNHDFCLPNKLFEMTLAGLPIVVSNTTELSRFVAETGTGIAVNAADPAAISAGIAHVYTARHSLRPDAAALAGLRARFAWERQAERLIDVYAAVANGPQGLPAAMARRALATAWRPMGRPATALGSGG